MGAGGGSAPGINPDKLLYGLSINHSEGFTDPAQQAAHAGEISAAQLYRATVYKQVSDGTLREPAPTSVVTDHQRPGAAARFWTSRTRRWQRSTSARPCSSGKPSRRSRTSRGMQ